MAIDSTTDPKRLYHGFAGLAGAVSCVLGCVVLAGWQFDFETAKSVMPGFATMKPNTALCFLLCGAALWLLTRGRDTQLGWAPRRTAIARICAAAVLALALWTTAADLFGFETGLDEWLFAAGPGEPEGLAPGRMSLATAVNFVLLSATLLLLTDVWPRWQGFAQHSALIVVWIAFVALVGYAYGTSAPFGGSSLPVASASFASMAVHTSVMFVLLGLGCLVLRPDRGMMAQISSPFLGGSMARRVLPATVVVASFLFWLGIAGRQSESYDVGFRLSVAAIAIVSMLALVIWGNAKSLNKLDAQRLEAEKRNLQSLREKEVLLKEIHHRVKNNLQIVSSLLNLESRRVDAPEARKVFDDSRLRIQTMALIHEQLYKSPDLGRIEFSRYLDELLGHVLQTYNAASDRVSAKLNVEDVRMPVDTAIPCALIVNELVSNSLKYAFPDGRPGEIRIDLRNTAGQQTKLCVADTGVGFPPDIDPEKSRTLGLRLVRTLAEQLGGEAQFHSEGGAGVEITFRSGAA